MPPFLFPQIPVRASLFTLHASRRRFVETPKSAVLRSLPSRHYVDILKFSIPVPMTSKSGDSRLGV
jgi:hypothetical protein